MIKTLMSILLVLLVACAPAPLEKEISLEEAPSFDTYAVATFAGGCFWCTESDFEHVAGVVEAISGYAGGVEENPSYKEVSSGATSHTEAVQVYYDPNVISYKELLDVFWKHHDPTDANGQFVDRGSQYRPAIFYETVEEQLLAIQTRDDLAALGVFDEPIVTEIVAFSTFYPAEEYHQDYYLKNPIRYKLYRGGSGRDQFLSKYWSLPEANAGKTQYSKPEEAVLRTQLSPLQYQVTQEDGTERAFDNEYWDLYEEGIYVDIVSGEPLFSSTDKFKSGTGWPSFTKPIDPEMVVLKKDFKLVVPRIEVRSKYADSHLGHLFDDGPAPLNDRYCMNSAALRFVPLENMEAEGYREYLHLFE